LYELHIAFVISTELSHRVTNIVDYGAVRKLRYLSHCVSPSSLWHRLLFRGGGRKDMSGTPPTAKCQILKVVETYDTSAVMGCRSNPGRKRARCIASAGAAAQPPRAATRTGHAAFSWSNGILFGPDRGTATGWRLVEDAGCLSEALLSRRLHGRMSAGRGLWIPGLPPSVTSRNDQARK
jgi:hypothetical protein